MQWFVTERPVRGGEYIEAKTPRGAVRVFAERYFSFDNGIRYLRANGVEYKVTITRGVVEGVEEVQP